MQNFKFLALLVEILFSGDGLRLCTDSFFTYYICAMIYLIIYLLLELKYWLTKQRYNEKHHKYYQKLNENSQSNFQNTSRVLVRANKKYYYRKVILFTILDCFIVSRGVNHLFNQVWRVFQPINKKVVVAFGPVLFTYFSNHIGCTRGKANIVLESQNGSWLA